ncbi:MAG: ATP-binding cassette domain-containing protein [Muribaculaceae bacterium]|nr:ATP-binding cassette domain-containing protein [Muribaculaceae bacterium]
MSSIIEYHDVELLRKEHVVLKHVSMQVQPGEFVYLIGSVGSGKSTLLKSMYGEVAVESGEARVFDFNLRQLKRKQIPMLRRKIGIVFQDFQLLMERNVYANLDFVLRATGWKDASEREERIDRVLAIVGMGNKSYKMPHELSGGEQQRIVIARALLNSPELILADEPTGNLDPATGEQIIRHLYEISQQGTAVVVATHNIGLINHFPGHVMRCGGKKLEAEQTGLEA